MACCPYCAANSRDVVGCSWSPADAVKTTTVAAAARYYREPACLSKASSGIARSGAVSRRRKAVISSAYGDTSYGWAPASWRLRTRRSVDCGRIDGGPFYCNDHGRFVGERKPVWASPTCGCAMQVLRSVGPLARGRPAFNWLLRQHRSERGRPVRCVFARAISMVGAA
jgi:hypothetical protein